MAIKLSKQAQKGTMDSQLYIRSLNMEGMWGSDSGDQSLILADIMACFKDCHVIALPYPCDTLALALRDADKMVLHDHIQGAEGVYWGTPTVVDDKALFPKCLRSGECPALWTVEHERLTSRKFADMAENFGAKVIVTGLGSGDIKPAMRINDMGGGQVVSYKRFDDFEDWVICRRLK